MSILVTTQHSTLQNMFYSYTHCHGKECRNVCSGSGPVFYLHIPNINSITLFIATSLTQIVIKTWKSTTTVINED